MLRLRRNCPLDALFSVPFHPSVQQILLETPPITELERYASNLFLAQVLVQRVWGDPEVLGRLAQRHHFLCSFHFLPCLSQTMGCFLLVLSRCFLGVFPVFAPFYGG